MTSHKTRVDEAKDRIERDSAFALHVFHTIWDAQTPAEKVTHQHGESDHRGFSPYETPYWCRLYDELEDRGWLPTPKEVDTIRKGMRKHADQYIRLKDEKLAAYKERMGI